MNTKHTLILIVLCIVAAGLSACTFSTTKNTQGAPTSVPALPTRTPAEFGPIMTESPAPATNTPAPTSTPFTSSGSAGADYTGQSVGNVGSVSAGSSTTTTTGSSSSSVPGYTITQHGPGPACAVTAYGSYNVNVRQTPGLNGYIVGSLQAGSWVAALQRVNNWYQISYPNTPTHNGWISGEVVELNMPCTCDPYCRVVTQPPTPERCQIQNYMAQGLSVGPGAGYAHVTELGPDTISPVDSCTPDRRFCRVMSPQGLEGWLGTAQNVSFVGNCTNVPVDSLGPAPAQACQALNYMRQGLVGAPSPTAPYIAELGHRNVSGVIACTSDHTFCRVASPRDESWLDVRSNVTFYGPCDNIPVEDPAPTPQVCTIQNQMAQGIMSGPGSDYDPVGKLGPNTISPVQACTSDHAFCRIDSPVGVGWISTVENVSFQGDCGSVPIEDPAPPSTQPQSYTNPVYGYTVDYPGGWYIRDTTSEVILTSYDPANGDPAHAAFTNPALVKINIYAEEFSGSYEDFFAQYVARAGTPLEIFSQETITLPGGIPALRLEMVSGTGGFPLLITVINGSGITIDGWVANAALFDQVATTLRAG